MYYLVNFLQNTSILLTVDDNGKKHYQQIITSGWKMTQTLEEEAVERVEPTTMPMFEKAALEKMKIAQLRQICK